jgi:D-glycero-alpha-D-manno-heptose-7-phosphate kinase
VFYLEILDAERVVVNPLRPPSDVIAEFETSLVICFSGRSRDSASIIDEQIEGMVHHTPGAMESLHQLKRDAYDMKDALLRGQIDEVANILNRSWIAKKATAGAVSNPHLEQLYDLAFGSGAIAGKVSGAGGGGFMMFIVAPEDRLGLIQALNETGARASPVKFTTVGCEAWQAPRR